MGPHRTTRATDAALSTLLAQNTSGVRRLLEAIRAVPVREDGTSMQVSQLAALDPRGPRVLPVDSHAVRSHRMQSDLERLRAARVGARDGACS